MMTPEGKCPYCDFTTGIDAMMSGHIRRVHPGGVTITPDIGPRNTMFHKRIVASERIPNTQTGSHVKLECGHRVMMFGAIENAEGVAFCDQCKRDFERAPKS
jgi:hypothetical protein